MNGGVCYLPRVPELSHMTRVTHESIGRLGEVCFPLLDLGTGMVLLNAVLALNAGELAAVRS